MALAASMSVTVPPSRAKLWADSELIAPLPRMRRRSGRSARLKNVSMENAPKISIKSRADHDTHLYCARDVACQFRHADRPHANNIAARWQPKHVVIILINVCRSNNFSVAYCPNDVWSMGMRHATDQNDPANYARIGRVGAGTHC